MTTKKIEFRLLIFVVRDNRLGGDIYIKSIVDIIIGGYHIRV